MSQNKLNKNIREVAAKNRFWTWESWIKSSSYLRREG